MGGRNQGGLDVLSPRERQVPEHLPSGRNNDAIAAELAVAHGGTLTADSQPGHGATFALTLPLA